jgi:hypothetical protein
MVAALVLPSRQLYLSAHLRRHIARPHRIDPVLKIAVRTIEILDGAEGAAGVDGSIAMDEDLSGTRVMDAICRRPSTLRLTRLRIR